jgi:maltooligosyltrehalose trehalohydrolase
VVFAQNHDHVGNRPGGERLSGLAGFDALRLVAAAVLLAPGVPLLFMGEEYGETAPFPYFVDHGDPALREAVRDGRAAEMADYGLDGQAMLDPTAESTRAVAVLDHSLKEVGDHRRLWRLHAELLAFRRDHPAFGRLTRPAASARATGPVLILVRSAAGAHAAVVWNFSGAPVRADLPDGPPGEGGRWTLRLDSGNEALGGSGEGVAVDGATVTLAGLAFGVLDWLDDPRKGRD